MNKKVFVYILALILSLVYITGCSIFAKNDILSIVKNIEKNNEMFNSFKISYDDYYANINEYLTDNYKKNNLQDSPFIQTSDTTINYNSLSGKSASEIQKLVENIYYVSGDYTLKEHLMSDIYNSEDENIRFVYVKKVTSNTIENNESDNNYIILFKKYKIIKANRNWYIESVESKYANYSTDGNTENSGFKSSDYNEIEYQYIIEHNDK